MSETTAKLLAQATEALETAYTLGLLAILDESQLARFASDVTANVARQAVFGLTTDELVEIVVDGGWLEPGRSPLKAGWHNTGFELAAASRGSSLRPLSFRGQLQSRLAASLRSALLKRSTFRPENCAGTAAKTY